MIILENIAGAFLNPNEITLYTKVPNFVTSVVFPLSSSTIGTWLNPERSFVKE